MTNKLGRMMGFLDVLLPVMSSDPQIMWPCEIQGSLTLRSSSRTCLRRFLVIVLE